jgi:leucyl/phenylalanyl-tRNA--protein transferase
VRTPRIHWIKSSDPADSFPAADSAFELPDGLLAAGGDLSRERLLYAYAHGIFPWYSEGQPILWWSPDPRCIMLPAELSIPRRSLRAIRNSGFRIGFNRAFDRVIDECAAERPGQGSTWITEEMNAAYNGLHRSGWAHSAEVWQNDALVGGMYGIAIGKAFFGESMFSRVNNASKAAMLALCAVLVRNEFAVLDCQVASRHLMTLGAQLLPRKDFLQLLASACHDGAPFAAWPAGLLPVGNFIADPALQ